MRMLRALEEAGWALPGIRLKSLMKLENPFFFFKTVL
jgi:hypothetical protein